jgi:hypothetical protein
MQTPNELEQHYAQRITEILESVAAAIETGEITNEDERDTWIYESIDQSSIIYTREAIQTLLCSANENAWTDDVGSDIPMHGDRINWSALALFAMRQDVNDRLPAWEDKEN